MVGERQTISTVARVHGGGVVGGRVQHAVGDREQVGLVVGGADGLEAGGGIDLPGREQIGHRRQGARGGLGVAHAEAQRPIALEDPGQRDARALLHDDDALVAVGPAGVHRAGEHLGVGTAHGLQARQVGEPAHVGLLEPHGLDQGRVVGAVVGLHRHADGLLHVGEERGPVLLGAGLALGREDGEGQLLARLGLGGGRRQDGGRQGRGGGAEGQDKSAVHGCSRGGSRKPRTSRVARLTPNRTPGADRSKAMAWPLTGIGRVATSVSAPPPLGTSRT